ncbi:putative dodecin [Pseudomonas congelans]|uniref:Putative dodecin n=1 Tax=Pseudomonas congelans TaxID=200452 RepID=A0A0P9PJR0_9PSED|nr:putative dodecin [Pseudomonas congelans]
MTEAGSALYIASFSDLRRTVMSDHHTYKKVEIVGSSTTTIEDAINNALAEASKSLDLMEWFEVTETRGHIENGKVAHFQVTLKVGFRITNS